MEASKKVVVIGVNENDYTTCEYDDHEIVNLLTMSCSCRVLDVDKLPCPYAIMTLSKRYPDTFGDSVYNHFSAYYSPDAYYKAYKGDIIQIPHESKWMITLYMQGAEVPPPKYASKPGRKGNKHKKSCLEGARSSTKKPTKRRNKCSLCKQPGHKKTTYNMIFYKIRDKLSSEFVVGLLPF
ncbi:hypothetical protein RND71_014397 [Anisodus tanguticus]|uniref:SWIM-type domain-containing protein n=1 Tax=Anisodus tanguticus TaxID=243964 RepID=A0AAE1VF06_9SOLA|nr:hypothetical protein RND71_014397 [Anisodus tanguticus]